MTMAQPVPAQPRNAAAAPPPRPCLSTRDLFAAARKLSIEHDGKIYTLQLTRQNRLLLTK